MTSKKPHIAATGRGRLICSAVAVVASAWSAHAFAAAPAGYTLSWSDEFNTTALDTTQWNYRLDTRFWSIQQAANVSVSGGYLNLHLKKETVGTFNYTAGGVITKNPVRYGYYETSMKTPPGAGWHTSFWMMRNGSGAATGTSATFIELDALENDSLHPTYYGVNVHRWQPSHTTFGTKTVNTANLNTAFHTVACEFMPSYVKYYFDGTLVQTVDATQFPHSDVNIWLTSVAAPLGGTTAVDDTQLPAVAQYDYVRYYTPNVSTAQNIYQWNGTSNTGWTTAGNWNASPGTGTTGATFNARLQVYNGSGNGLIYDASLGTTRYYNVYERGLVVGNYAQNGSMTITGGTFSTYNSAAEDVIANTTGVTGTLTIAGGNFIGNIFGTILDFGGTCNGKVIVNSGSATFTTLTMSNSNSGTSLVDLNGGTITANQIKTNASAGDSTFNFNGGTLKAGATTTTFFQGIKNAKVKSGGATIDTNAKNITIAQPLLNDPTSTGGGLKKTGTGTLTLSGACTYTGPTTVSAGTLVLTGSIYPTTAGAIQVSGTAVLDVSGGSANANSITATNLNIRNNGRVRVAPSSASACDITTLSILTGGQLDLANNGLIVRATGARAAVRALVDSGRNGIDTAGLVNWNGSGIISSTARSANQSSLMNLYTLAVIRNGDLDDQAGPGSSFTTFAGKSVGAEDTLVKYTYNGDTNLDGTITIVDYVAIDSTYAGTGANRGWVSGDFDGDGTIGITDYVAIDLGYAFQNGALSTAMLEQRFLQFGDTYASAFNGALAVVPEPSFAAISLVITCGVLEMRGRRRRAIPKNG